MENKNLEINIKTDLKNQKLKSEEKFSKKDKKYILSLLEKDMKQLEINIKEKSSKEAFVLFEQYLETRNSYEKLLLLQVESKNELFFD